MKLVSTVVICLLSFNCFSQKFTKRKALKQESHAWKKKIVSIIRSIEQPTFSSVQVFIQDTTAFIQKLQRVIDSIHKTGGGNIVINPENYIAN
jgi:hypothetical protein